MQFRTEINLPQAADKVQLGHRLLTLGSCFAEVIGRRLSDYKLDTLINPFGTIFNPISQFELVQAALAPEEQEELPMVQQNGHWYAYNFHSSFTAPTRQELQEQIEFSLTLVREQIEKAQTIIFTFGTALVYQLAESDRIVANCHKMPQSNFNKHLLQSEEIVTCFAEMFALIKSVNPSVRVILTVSPVRHVKDTLVLNSVSKAVLRVACHYLAEMLPEVTYFPAFELLVDDLRDYRFYKDDLLHPTEMAEEYVWQKFSEAYFDDKLQRFTAEWSRIRQALGHKPFQQDSEGHQQFLQGLLKQLEQLGRTVNVKAEIAQVKQQLMPVRRNKAPKKAPLELVNLLETLAASDVMAEDEDGYRSAPVSRHQPEREVTLSEAFAWPDQEDETPLPDEEFEAEIQLAQIQTAPEPAFILETPEPEIEPEPVTVSPEVQAEAPVAPVQEPFVHTKKSKSKKRREKRRAKLLASRGLTVSRAPIEEEAGEVAAQPVTENTENVAVANQPETVPAGRPVKKARNQRNKVASKTAADVVPTEELPVTLETVQEPVVSPSDTSEPNAENPVTATSEAPTAPVRKKPGRKPAAAVGALLNALAQAQAPVLAPAPKPARTPRTPRKPIVLPPPVSEAPVEDVVTPPETNLTPTGDAVITPSTPIAKPKRVPVRKVKLTSPELPFASANTSEIAQAQPVTPEPEQPAAEASPAKPVKEPKPKKEPATPRKGKAKKIVLQKSPSGKGGAAS